MHIRLERTHIHEGLAYKDKYGLLVQTVRKDTLDTLKDSKYFHVV